MTRLNLQSAYQIFQQATGFLVLCAAELEFYLIPVSQPVSIDDFSAVLAELCRELPVKVSPLTKERGLHQYELHTIPTDLPLALAEAMLLLRDQFIPEAARLCGVTAVMSPLPFSDQPGNGMHIHISLWDKEGKAVFAKDSGEEESLMMRYAIGGLLTALPSSVAAFVPTEDSRKRIRHGGAEVPTMVSWGGNNRSVALRIPESTGIPEMRHIEHRVPGMDADPYEVFCAILDGIREGIVGKIVPPCPKIWGNADDAQYTKAPYHLKPILHFMNAKTP
jgi:glutamine synthetase